ncbi:MAG: hypothetical protein ISS95_00685 [Candidatus Aenigmarchaeota archaeon]|nr:hypothetical protein [Candidatus Aenigmarchaeota archaeon]
MKLKRYEVAFMNAEPDCKKCGTKMVYKKIRNIDMAEIEEAYECPSCGKVEYITI